MTAAGSFAGFVKLFSDLDATTSTDRRIQLIAEFLRSADDHDSAWAVTLLSGKLRRRFLTSRTLRAAALPFAGLPEWLFEESYAHVGDGAETIALLCAGGAEGQPGADDRGSESLSDWMERIVPEIAAMDERRRRERLAAIWRASSVTTALVVNKLFTGGFRVGVSEKTVVRAVADVSGLPPSVVARRMTGWNSSSAHSYRALVDPEDSALDAGAAYPFFLASPLEDASQLDADLSQWHFEWKWDGIRVLVIVRGRTVTLWSRGEESINESFPDIAEAAVELPDGTVLDGELLADRGDGTPAPFSELQVRLGRKKPTRSLMIDRPVFVNVYDALELDRRDIRDYALEQRRRGAAEALEALPDWARDRFRFSEAVSVDSLETMERLRTGARDRAVEGLMIKRVGSPYRAGRTRGDWWKFKADPFTLDAVLIYAQAGSGKRANLFTDYTFALRDGDDFVPIARAYSGLSNDEIARLDRWIRRNTVEKYGPARAVRPELVYEIAFEGIAPSARHKSGLATRFPRIVRFREDKSADQADTLEAAWELARRINPR